MFKRFRVEKKAGKGVLTENQAARAKSHEPVEKLIELKWRLVSENSQLFDPPYNIFGGRDTPPPTTFLFLDEIDPPTTATTFFGQKDPPTTFFSSDSSIQHFFSI